MGIIGRLLLGIVLTAIAYMAFPLIMLYTNHSKFEKKRANKIALWNSVVVGVLFCFLTVFTDSTSTWNAAPAVLYYWINRSILIDRTAGEDNPPETTQVVSNLSMPVSTATPIVNQTTAETSKIETSIEAAKFQFCRICGCKLPMDANFCTKCGTKISTDDKCAIDNIDVQKAEEARRATEYLLALEDYKSNEITRLQNAIEVFTSLGDYKDSNVCVKLCQDKIDSIRIKEENDRIERARKAEEKRIADEKARLEKQRQEKNNTKQNKNIVTIVTVVLLVIIVIGSSSYFIAYNKTCGWGNYREYIIDNNVTEFTIPSSMKKIDDYAFADCISLTSVIIPDHVTSIGASAFENCTSIETVTIGEGVTRIGKNAFYGCTNLVDIIIPDSVTSIGISSFQNCKSVTSLTIGEGITSIGNYAFMDCTNIGEIYYNANECSDFELYNGIFHNVGKSVYNAKVIIGTNVKKIPANFFLSSAASSSAISSIEFEEGSTCQSIGMHAFNGCAKITSVTIPNGVKNIGSGAFYDCRSLTNILIPNNVVNIDSMAFYGCDSLVSAIIGNGVVSIGSGAFASCTSLANIVIPDSVTYIENGVLLDNCTNLVFNIYDNAKYLGNDKNKYLYLYEVIDENITSINIHNTTKFIGANAFNGCTKLKNIVLPNSLMNVGVSAFANCTGITTIHIPDNVTSIGNFAFENCTNLKHITIPNGIQSIGTLIFSGCTNLLFNIYDNAVYLGNDQNKYLYLYKSVNNKITSVNIYSGTKIVESGAFFECTQLQSVIIPYGITEIRTSTFYGCTNLNSISIPDSVKSIEGYAFQDCTNLTSIIIPSSITKIGLCAFQGCINIQKIIFNGTKEQWESISEDLEWNLNTGNYTVYCTDGTISK